MRVHHLAVVATRVRGVGPPLVSGGYGGVAVENEKARQGS